jgi:peptidyl-prolyl cis-trans isomerase B (cyclophilin B)
MSGSKRQRKLAREKYERQQARRGHRVDRRRRNQRIIAVVVMVGLVFGGVAWAVLATRSDDIPAALQPTASASASVSASAAASPSAPASPSPAPSASTTPADSSPASASAAVSDPAAGESGVLDCTAPGTPRANDMTFASAPADGTGTSITLATNCGDIVIALDPAAPTTVASEVFLAKQGFYDGTTCHRLTTSGIFVLQCGDPAGDGTGGPGYTVPDENLPAEGAANYPAGTVAMANAGPGTSGSQFFIVYDDTTLPAGYSVWGHVTQGLDLVKEVASVGVDGGGADGTPMQPVFIESATVQQN